MLMKEDSGLPESMHGKATLNDQLFLYRRPDGQFLYDIFHAIFLRLDNVKLQFSRNGFPEDRLQWDSKLKAKTIWFYLDILRSNDSRVTEGKLIVEFGVGGEYDLHPYKPKYPNCSPIAPRENEVDVYVLPVKFMRWSNGKFLYQIYCTVDDDLTIHPVTFRSPYIFTNEFGHDEISPPPDWSDGKFRGAIRPDEDVEIEILPVSWRARLKPIDLTPVRKVTVSDNEKKLAPSPPRKRSREDVEIQAREYAINHLINDEDIRKEAVRQHMEKYCKSEMPGILEKLEEKILHDIETDELKREQFMERIREKAMNRILATERDSLREKVLECLIKNAAENLLVTAQSNPGDFSVSFPVSNGWSNAVDSSSGSNGVIGDRFAGTF